MLPVPPRDEEQRHGKYQQQDQHQRDLPLPRPLTKRLLRQLLLTRDIIMKRQRISPRTCIATQLLDLPIVQIQQKRIRLARLAFLLQDLTLQIGVTLLKPIRVRRVLRLQTLQIIRRRIGLRFAQKKLHNLRIPRVRTKLLRQPTAYFQPLRNTIRKTKLIPVRPYIQLQNRTLRLFRKTLGFGKIIQHTVLLPLRQRRRTRYIPICASQISKVLTLPKQRNGLAVVFLGDLVQHLALGSVSQMKPRQPQQLRPLCLHLRR